VAAEPVIRHLTYREQPVTSEDAEIWLMARRRGVTATDCAKIVRKNGTPSSQRQTLLAQKLYGLRGPDYTVYAHGREREPHIAAWVEAEFGIAHNTSLCVGEDNRHMATPDAVGEGGIAEFKTATQPLAKAIRTYSDQLQWQMHVLHTERVLFVVEDRHTLAREWTACTRTSRPSAVVPTPSQPSTIGSCSSRRPTPRSDHRSCWLRAAARTSTRAQSGCSVGGTASGTSPTSRPRSGWSRSNRLT